MRVLHLINAFNRGGIERWLLNVLREISRDSCGIDFCCKGANVGPWATTASELGAEVYHCPLRPSHVGFVRGLRKLLGANRYDLVHNHLGPYSGIAVWVAGKQGVPIITTFHNSDFPPGTPLFLKPGPYHLRKVYSRFSIDYSIRKSDALTCISKGVMEAVIPDRPDIRAKTSVQYYGMDLPPVATPEQRAEFRRSMGWPDDTPIVIHVGRFFEQKNHFGLLKTFRYVLEQVPSAKLLLVGVGPLMEAVQSYIGKHGLSDSVTILGPTDDACSLMARCDVMLFPSFWEGFGLVALEANAVGIPVVASNVTGINEAVEDGLTAMLHDVADRHGMARSVVRILVDKQFAESLGTAGRARAETMFSVKASSEALLRCYRELLRR